jgi:hypothetical protein
MQSSSLKFLQTEVIFQHTVISYVAVRKFEADIALFVYHNGTVKILQQLKSSLSRTVYCLPTISRVDIVARKLQHIP